MSNDDLKMLRKQLVNALSGGESHTTFDKVVKDFPPQARGTKPHNTPHSAWELVEHMRIAQRDILDFARDPKHQSPEFPKGYWHESESPPSEAAWKQSVDAFQRDSKELGQLLETADLFASLPHGQGHTLLREAVVAANHNSYQLGQLVFLKRMLSGKAQE
jgi:DinB superfamily